MTIEEKQASLSKLREAFITFMNAAVELPGARMQKQTGFIRFDEGHMWLQNAIMSYEEPKE